MTVELENKKVPQSFSLDPEMLVKLRALAKQKEWTISKTADYIFKNYFDKTEGTK